jgi:uncharacterized protein (TIGR00255 family)
MRSMTGFGQATADNGRWRVDVTLRGVNGRFLDLVIRLPDELRGSEPALRERLSGVLSRGRVEMAVGCAPAAAALRAPWQPDIGALTALRSTAVDLQTRGLLDDVRLGLADLLAARDLLRPSAPAATPAAWEEADGAQLTSAVDDALAGFLVHREREGAALAAVLAARLDDLVALQQVLSARRPAAQADLLGNLRRRLAELLGDVDLPAERLAQEVALLTDRSDVSEELDRLAAHLEHFRELLVPGSAAVGKRLDFLTQEIHRELNTLGSKCRDLAMGRAVLDAKLACEQLREQVQNVE